MKIQELSDGRYIGCNVFEISAFPDVDSFSCDLPNAIVQNIQTFQQVIKEYHKLGRDINCCAEFVWITEKIEGQAIKSRIRVFIVLRQIAPTHQYAQKNLDAISRHFKTSLSVGRFEITTTTEDTFISLLNQVNCNALYGIVKSEKCVGTTASAYPYYFCDVLPTENTDNFASLLAEMSLRENCCISFQLFPTTFSQQEYHFLQEQASALSRMTDGIMWGAQMIRDHTAQMPQKVMSYYADNASSAMFLYNIIVSGNRDTCAILSAKIISLLQAGKNSIATADCACVDMSNEQINLGEQAIIYPWNINNRLLFAYRNAKLQQSLLSAKILKRLPYVMTVDEAVTFFRMPIYENGMTGLTSNSGYQTTEQFDARNINTDGIELGSVYGKNDVVLHAPLNLFTKHAVITGMPGSGKTTFSINLLLQFAKRGVPFLAIEPTKSEYRAMIEQLPNMRVFTPGNNLVSPFIINPFLPPTGIRLEQYIPSLVSAFKAAFDMPSPLDVLFLNAVRTCYIEHGWKDYSVCTDQDVEIFGLREFILCFKRLIKKSTYSNDVKGNLESAGVYRLMSLIEQNGNIYDTIHTIPIEDLVSCPTVIELNAIENSEQKALIIALLLINICIYTKNNTSGNGKLKNILLIDEAHVLLGKQAGHFPNDAQAMTTKAIQDMVAEIRSFGTGIIIADQRPSQIGREIIANTEIKMTFRLVEGSEKELISDSTNMDAQVVKQLGGLGIGEAYYHSSLLQAPYRLVTKDVRSDKNIQLDVSNDDIIRKMHYWDNHQELLRPYAECQYCHECKGSCDFRLRSQAEYYASRLLNQNSAKIIDAAMLEKFIVSMDALLGKVMINFSDEKKKRLIDCCRIRFMQKVKLDKAIAIDPKRFKKILLDY